MTLNDISYSVMDIVTLIRFNGNLKVTSILIKSRSREARNGIKVVMLLIRMPEAF